MKLTGKLKDEVSKVDSLEEKKNIIAQAGMELTDDELENVAGGAYKHVNSNGSVVDKIPPKPEA